MEFVNLDKDNIEAASKIISAIILFIIAILRYLSRATLEKRKKEERYSTNKIHLLKMNKKLLKKKEYERLKREIYFHNTFGIYLSNTTMNTIVQIKSNQFFDDIKKGGSKLKEETTDNKSQLIQRYNKSERVFDIFMILFGLFVMWFSFLVPFYLTGAYGVLIFLFFSISGLLLFIFGGLDLEKYSAADRVIKTYRDYTVSKKLN